MLIRRLFTAAALAAVLLPILFLGSAWWWASVTLIFLLAASWEWQRLIKPMPFQLSRVMTWPRGVVVMAVIGGLTLYGLFSNITPAYFDLFLYCAVSLFWIVAAIPLMRYQQVHRLSLWVVLFLLLAAWWAVIAARAIGIGYLLSIIFLVIAADSFAYFVGRAIGRHKLAPTISPGKTIEGVLGGAVGVLLTAAIFIQYVPWDNFFRLSWQKLGYFACLPWLTLLFFSVVGDLFESALKRAVNVKDSSQLLPGHGGVLDRIDALLPTLPLAMLITYFLNQL
ncbi:phosphatidate cytidylyltransferase [Parvibium lacunae]|nr:phosphatidate cytidylyltransferase [Parvibium lacunae]